MSQKNEDEKRDEEQNNNNSTQILRFNPELIQRLHDKVIGVTPPFSTNEDMIKIQALINDFLSNVQSLYAYLLKEINEGHARFSVTASTIVNDFQRLLSTVTSDLFVLSNKMITYIKQRLQESVAKKDVTETIANILRSIDTAFAITITMQRIINALIGKMNINLPSALTSREYAEGVLGLDINI